MGINILKIGLLITATQFFLASGCNKNDTKPCAMVTPFSFNVTSEFSPQREVYNVGDTIFLNSTFTKNFTNLISNQQVDYSNSVGIGGNFNLLHMDTVNRQIKDGLNNFLLITINGMLSANPNVINLGKVVTFYESNSNYSIKIGIKLLQKGLFYFVLTDLYSNGLIGKNCTNAGFNMTVTNSNKNLNLFQYALGYAPDALLQKSIFCFRVQ